MVYAREQFRKCACLHIADHVADGLIGAVVAHHKARQAVVDVCTRPTTSGRQTFAIPSFIMTLAMLQIGAGVCAMLVRGQIAYAVPHVIATLGNGSLGPVAWIVIMAALVMLVAHLVLTYPRFGRYVYMVGGNREAAEYSGVNVNRIIGAVMVI